MTEISNTWKTLSFHKARKTGKYSHKELAVALLSRLMNL
jgi:hypothetical protein